MFIRCISNKEHLYSKKSMLTRKIGITPPSSCGGRGALMKPSPTPPFDPYSPRFDPPSPLRYPIPLVYTPIPLERRIDSESPRSLSLPLLMTYILYSPGVLLYTILCCFLYYSLIVFDIEERVNVYIMYSTSRLLTEHVILVIV